MNDCIMNSKFIGKKLTKKKNKPTIVVVLKQIIYIILFLIKLSMFYQPDGFLKKSLIIICKANQTNNYLNEFIFMGFHITVKLLNL